MALLKTKVSYQALGRLLQELGKVPNQFQIITHPAGEDPKGPGRRVSFVKVFPGDRKFDGENIEVHLDLLETFSTTDVDREMSGLIAKVSRDMRDKLDDMLGIFPRTTRGIDLESILAQVTLIRMKGAEIRDVHLNPDMERRGGVVKARDKAHDIVEATQRLVDLLMVKD